MNLIYETVHFKGSEKLEQLVNQKIESITLKNPEIIQSRVTLTEDASGNPENQVCEIRLEIPGNDIFVKKNAATYEQALRMAVEAAQKMISKRKNN